MKRRKIQPQAPEDTNLDTHPSGPTPRGGANGHVRPLIDDENDHEARQSRDAREWGSLFDRAD